MKSYLIVFCLAFSTGLVAQSLYVKSETETKGLPAMVAKMSKSSSEVWMKPGKTKTKTKLMAYTQTQYSTSEGVTILNTADPKCVIISKQELAEDSILNNVYTTDVVVKKTQESRVILGYTCYKTIMTYKAANSEREGVKLTYEMLLWVCPDLKWGNAQAGGLESSKRNSLSVALQRLEGFVLHSETLVKENNMKVIVSTTAISEKSIPDSEFEVAASACKKFLNLKEYNAYLKKQNIKPTGWY